MNEIKEYTEKLFENIKHIDEEGNEYWYARELMPLLEYSKWENFNNVIKKAAIAYRNSNKDDSYWLPEVRKPIITGKGKEEFIKDYKLSKTSLFGCPYLLFLPTLIMEYFGLISSINSLPLLVLDP